jgi:hypothetical protein
MSKGRPAACKNLRSFQTAKKGDLENACPWGAEIGPAQKGDLECADASPLFFRGDISPRSEARTCPRTPNGPREGSRKNYSLGQRAPKVTPHGRSLPTCDLVKATSLLVSVLLPHNVNRLWDLAGPQFLHTLGTAEPCSAENRLAFQQSEIGSGYRLGGAQGLTPSGTDAAAIHPCREPLLC